MFPARFATPLFSLFLSGMMSFIISGISTFRAAGLADNFVRLWAGAWAVSWLIAFPTVMVVAPLARRMVQRLVKA